MRQEGRRLLGREMVRQAEVRHARPSLAVEQHVVRLQVEVEDAVVVGERDGLRHRR
jgi:hypothetical protein